MKDLKEKNNSSQFSEFVNRYKTVKKHKRLMLYFIVGAFVLITIYNIFCTRLYKSSATMIPIESAKNDMFSYLTGQSVIGALSSLVGGVSTSSEKLLNVLTSRTVTEEVIKNLNLMPKLFPGDWDTKRKKWKNPDEMPFMEVAVEIMQEDIAELKDTKEGLLLISVIWEDPEFAMKIVKQYITELQNFLNMNSFSVGKKNRTFLKEQLKNTELELAEAENNLKNFQETNKIISLDAQAEMTVKTIANIKAEIISRDYQLGFLKNTTGLHSSKAKKIIEEKNELRRQLWKLESGNSRSNKKGETNSLVSVKDFPALEVEFLRLKREFLILEKVYELLTTQHELAKIEEVRDQIAFQIIDDARIPMKRYKPKIKLNTAIALLAAFVFSLFTIVLIEGVDWNAFKD